MSKTFADYESRMFKQLAEAENSGGREYLGRIREVMKDKYRLADKFEIICCQLCPSDADADLNDFRKAKKIRDEMAHGEEVADAAFPVAVVQGLLKKYLKMHM